MKRPLRLKDELSPTSELLMSVTPLDNIVAMATTTDLDNLISVSCQHLNLPQRFLCRCEFCYPFF